MTEPKTLTTADAVAVREKDIVALGRSCPNSDCVFRKQVAPGGYPCRDCRHLTKGDYLVTEL